ncbi:MAG: hypothetical protein ACRDTC_14755 [Pseudonocardiaceae bacterium]
MATDNAISKSTEHDYPYEGIDALAARTPGLHSTLLVAKAGGYSHVIIDGR